MRILFWTILFAVALEGAPAHAQIKVGGTTIAFATVDQAAKILTNRDDFVQRLSPFDRAARMKTSVDVSEADYLEFVATNILAWNDANKQKVTAAIEGIRPELETLSLPFPREVLLIKTTGNEEGRTAYTRANAIVLPPADLAGPVPSVQKIVSHELFHILSRANPDLREKLYAAIGFEKCNEVDFPPELKSRKITNPDAPRNDHCIRLRVGDKEYWAIPILFADTDRYDRERGGEFFDYLQFRFLLVDRPDASSPIKPIEDAQQAALVGTKEVSGFYEQVGRNTGYILHPEEILADNFSLIVLQRHNVPSPAILEKLKRALNPAGAAGTGTSTNAASPQP